MSDIKQQRRLPGNLLGLTVLAITLSTVAMLFVAFGRLLGQMYLQFPK
ncbi:MAG TPA: hypothetical protein VJ085_09730 [Candidatus Acidoferrales bacterium]|nr:hypothetical protein [Candidatus Acidoferrales bacterium]